MPLLDLFRAARDHTRDQRYSLRANNEKLGLRLFDVFTRTWDLGFTVRNHMARQRFYLLTTLIEGLWWPSGTLSDPTPEICRRRGWKEQMD